MQSNRCRHYQLDTELIAVPGAPVLLHIPIRRCHLAEHMIARLTTTDKGAEVARKLMFASPLPSKVNTDDSQEPSSSNPLIRAVFGPDLEPIHHEDCIAQRCLSSCTPGYIFLLEHFGMDVDANHAMGKGCQEADAQESDKIAEITEDAL